MTKGILVDELLITLWAYHITLKQPTEETLYALTFGAEALIPVESSLDTLRTSDPSELSEALDEAQRETRSSSRKNGRVPQQSLSSTGETHQAKSFQKRRSCPPTNFQGGETETKLRRSLHNC